MCFASRFHSASRKHAYAILLLKPHLYTKTLVNRGIHVFLVLLKNIDCGYSLDPPRRGGSNEYPPFYEQKYENYQFFFI